MRELSCPFYGRALVVRVPGAGALVPTGGNQCALVGVAHAPCSMEAAGLPIDWGSCFFHRSRHPAGPDDIACCVGCGWPFKGTAGDLCDVCRVRAEQMAGQAWAEAPAR